MPPRVNYLSVQHPLALCRCIWWHKVPTHGESGADTQPGRCPLCFPFCAVPPYHVCFGSVTSCHGLKKPIAALQFPHSSH